MTTERLRAGLAARLDASLRGAPAPVAIGFSGGGDSTALLLLARDWARARGRPLIPLIVDHGLQAGSAEVAAAAAARAQAWGLTPAVVRWTGAKPAAGLQEAARDARQAMLAQACRARGVSALLLAHTRDDQAETVWLRILAGSSWRGLAAMRESAPSPSWPEGRGLVLIRPLLDAPRAELRAFLAEAAAEWTEDPANANPRFARTRARRTLAALAPAVAERLVAVARRARALADAEDEAALALWRAAGLATPDGALRLTPSALHGAGSLRLLQAALAAVSGQAREPSRDQAARALDRLRTGAAVALGGAVATLRAGEVLIHRDAGAVLGRAGVAASQPQPLTPGAETVWDGRFLIRAYAAGLKAGALGRDLSFLVEGAKERLATIPAPVRPVLPAVREGPAVVAVSAIGFGENVAEMRPLAEERLRRLLFTSASCSDAHA